MKKTSVCGLVILNYNSHDLTATLANRLSQYSSIDYICVVDNCSKDNFDNDFNHSKIHYIKNKSNTGYNAGNNIGLKYLVEKYKCDYVFIANPDVEFTDETIKNMCNQFDKERELVLLSTKRYGANGECIHQYFNFPTLKTSIKKCFFLTRRNFERDCNKQQSYVVDSARNGIVYVDAVPGAFFGIRSDFLKEIGYLYEGIFLYGEELFIGRQAYDRNKKVGVINNGEYYHNHVQRKFSSSNRKMFWYDRKSLIKYFEKFALLNHSELAKLKIAVLLGTIEYNLLFLCYRLLKGKDKDLHINHIHSFVDYPKFSIRAVADMPVESAEDYLRYIAEGNFERFNAIGYAVPGHNGPHGHLDTPVRNTAHYLIIYAYLYKTTLDEKYKALCEKFLNYLMSIQAQSSSGAIKCMESSSFDHLNGLIGQAWVIEALLYYYEVFEDKRCIDIAKEIFYAQKYDFDKHVWHRIELDGTDIGIDNAYNHQVWFAACSFKLSKYLNDSQIDLMIKDFLTKGADRDFRIYSDGLLKHTIALKSNGLKKDGIKRFIKIILTPLRRFNARKFDYKYIERAYHIFDMYGFTILESKYGGLPLFSSEKYKKALSLTKNISRYNSENNAFSAEKPFNVYSYSYNSPAFEYAFIAREHNCYDRTQDLLAFSTQVKLMQDEKTKLFSKNNPDIETWNARTYELIRYLDLVNLEKGGQVID